MRVKRNFAAFLWAFCLLAMSVFSDPGAMRVSASDKELVALGGLFGVNVKTDGVLVTALSPFESEGRVVSPGEDAGLIPGDDILKINGIEVSGAQMLAQAIAASGGEATDLTVRRENRETTLSLTPLRADADGIYRAGIYVKDRMVGVGTMTFYDPENGTFAGLGHGICDTETETLLPVKNGEINRVKLDQVVKGQSGSPGELQCSFTGGVIGQVLSNHLTGVYGTLKAPPDFGKAYPVAAKDEVRLGAAEILCDVAQNGVQSYAAEISEICNPRSETKNLLVTVTDPRLLELTGGIVQGMSGSPIIQDGKLIGALTHVLVNHPDRGYGIYAENMLRETQDAFMGRMVAAS